MKYIHIYSYVKNFFNLETCSYVILSIKTQNMVLSLAYAWCSVPVMPLRKEPNHKAEQTTQILFGERVEIMEVNSKDWAYIHNAWDGYEGWCKRSQLTMLTKKEFRKPVKYLAATHTDRVVLPDSNIWLPIGSELYGYKGGKMMVVGEAGKYKGKLLKVKELKPGCGEMKNAAMQYLHAPYQWGGKSIMGIDCSGLTQMAYRFCNVPIPRDASQQANEGELVDFLQHARCGDLAFFDNSDGKIVHVGLLLDSQTIIHATDTAGKVVIDRIDQAGIISKLLKARTHNLRFVKRIYN
jgi:cell wall-associated NlpC family hydrolase